MERLLLLLRKRTLEHEATMQQIVLPSLYAPDRRPATTQPFPLVRRHGREAVAKPKGRRFVAGLLFGTLMSLTLVLLGYEARIFWDQNPNVVHDAVQRAASIAR